MSSKHAAAEIAADAARFKTGRDIDRASRGFSRRSISAAKKRAHYPNTKDAQGNIVRKSTPGHPAFEGTLPGSHAYRSAAILNKMAHRTEPERTHRHIVHAGPASGGRRTRRRHRKGRRHTRNH